MFCVCRSVLHDCCFLVRIQSRRRLQQPVLRRREVSWPDQMSKVWQVWSLYTRTENIKLKQLCGQNVLFNVQRKQEQCITSNTWKHHNNKQKPKLNKQKHRHSYVKNVFIYIIKEHGSVMCVSVLFHCHVC